MLKELVSGKKKRRQPPEVHPYRCGFDEVAALHRFRFEEKSTKPKPWDTVGAGHGGAEDSMEGMFKVLLEEDLELLGFGSLANFDLGCWKFRMVRSD